MATRLKVDVTAVAAWERGTYQPRPAHRIAIANLLAADISTLFESDNPPTAALVDTLSQLPPLLDDALRRTRTSVRGLRLAAPYPTPAHVQQDFRRAIAARILDGSVEFQRVEIVYALPRLKEILSNILRYNGCKYYVKSYCAGLTEIAPAIGGYFFDDREFLLGAYWSGVPPHGRPGLQLSGHPFRIFFDSYWNEIWQRGQFLNHQGAHDLSAVRDMALELGLPAKQWPNFLRQARNLEIGDGAPPLP